MTEVILSLDPNRTVDIQHGLAALAEGFLLLPLPGDKALAEEEPTCFTDDPFNDYKERAARTPLLTAEQEVELAKRIEAGLYAEGKLETGNIKNPDLAVELDALALDGSRAKARFVEANLLLAIKGAKKYLWSDLPISDLTQFANLGVLKAVEHFDYKKGYKFSTYAMWWIRRELGEGIADTWRNIRMPKQIYDKVASYRQADYKLMQALERQPSIEEVAAELGISEEEASTLHAYLLGTSSLDAPVGEEGDMSFGDLIIEDVEPETKAIELALCRDAVVRALNILSCGEQRLLRPKYVEALLLLWGLSDEAGGQPYSQRAAAAAVGMKPLTLRVVEGRVLKALAAETFGLQAFLDDEN